jgi:hypothetical protein
LAEPIHELVSALMVEVLDSFEKLEIVLALERAGTSREVAAIAAELRLDDEQVADALGELAASGVCEAVAGGHRLTAEGAWRTHVDALAQLQRSDRMQVVALMSRAALERMRAAANRAFADAFIIRKKGGPDDG